ncbi:hypothetical protein [Brachybacterium tyrofermentans]|uniref:hypothetical protein n=1 Tax=Brachybacterium tyrofermentans TaxID=47848 RepID=UPI000A1AEFBE|nr:hypothetical protein FM103_08295 [Corynebacterium xerosis]
MKTRYTLTAALTCTAALALSGCGGSFDDSRELYEQLRTEIGCDTVDSDDFESFMEGELSDSFPAFDVVDGDCTLGDEDLSVSAVVPHDVKGEEFLEAMVAEESEGYAVHSAKWVVLLEGIDEENLEFAEAVHEELGGKIVTFSAAGVVEV